MLLYRGQVNSSDGPQCGVKLEFDTLYTMQLNELGEYLNYAKTLIKWSLKRCQL